MEQGNEALLKQTVQGNKTLLKQIKRKYCGIGSLGMMCSEEEGNKPYVCTVILLD